MVLLMFFEALYFGHFLSFYTMQPEPPKTNLLVPIYLLCPTELRRLQASGGGIIPQASPPPFGSLLQATPAGLLAPPGGIFPPHHKRSNTEDHRNTTRPLILFAAQRSVSPIVPASQDTLICAVSYQERGHTLN